MENEFADGFTIICYPSMPIEDLDQEADFSFYSSRYLKPIMFSMADGDDLLVCKSYISTTEVFPAPGFIVRHRNFHDFIVSLDSIINCGVIDTFAY